MSKVAQRLLRKSNELSHALRVVFTPVVTPPPVVTSEEAPSINKQNGAGGTQAEAGRGPKTTRGPKKPPQDVKPEGKPPQGRGEISRKRSRFKAFQASPEVVSEQLMDDVLAYLAPTLEQYKGCTLVDIYPGSCRWSRKVHEFLQPKSHLLLEPDTQYQDYVDELVNSPQSTYKHIGLPGAMHRDLSATYNHLFRSDGPIPATDRMSDSGPLSTNPSILVIGTLNRTQNVKYRGKSFSGSLASFYQFCYGALFKGYMHQSGPARMLLWLPEKDRIHFIPERTMYRTNSEAILSIGMHMQTAVAVQPIVTRSRVNEWSSRSRWTGLHLASEDIVRARAERFGMKVPENRQIFHLIPYDRSGPTKQAAKSSPYELRYDTKEQLEQAVDDLLRHWQKRKEWLKGMPHINGPRQRRSVDEVYDYLAYPELADALCEDPSKSYKAADAERVKKAKLDQAEEQGSLPHAKMGSSAGQDKRRYLSELGGTDVKIAVFADSALRGINLETHCKVLEEQGHDVTEIKRRLVEYADMVVQEVYSKRQVYIVDFYRLVDDWTAFFAPSQLLMSDRRHYEPLQADPSDFSHEGNLCLLDCIPTNRDLEVPGLADRRKVALALKDVVGHLYQFRGRSITTALEKLAPNASIDLVNMVPAITDPRKGGRLDPKHMKVRQLTSEMLEGLIKAWFEWPFKPDGWELNFRAQEIGHSNEYKGPLTPEAVTGDDDEGDVVD